MAARLAGHCSRRVTIVVTASGGGWKEECCAMAVLTCRYFTAPTAVMKTAIPKTIRIIRFFMRARPPLSTSQSAAGGVPVHRFLDFDPPLPEQGARRA